MYVTKRPCQNRWAPADWTPPLSGRPLGHGVRDSRRGGGAPRRRDQRVPRRALSLKAVAAGLQPNRDLPPLLLPAQLPRVDALLPHLHWRRRLARRHQLSPRPAAGASSQNSTRSSKLFARHTSLPTGNPRTPFSLPSARAHQSHAPLSHRHSLHPSRPLRRSAA